MSKVTEKVRRRKKSIVVSVSNLIKRTKSDRLTVRMICEEADISVGTFYHYFKNKDDLVAEIFGLIDDYLVSEVVPMLGSGDSIRDIVCFCRGYAEYMTMCGVRYCQVINSMFPFAKDYSDLRERQRPLFSILKGLIAQAMEINQIKAAYSADTLTEMLIVMLRGYCFDWARRGGGYDLVRRTAAYVKIFSNALRPAPVPLDIPEKERGFSGFEYQNKNTTPA